MIKKPQSSSTKKQTKGKQPTEKKTVFDKSIIQTKMKVFDQSIKILISKKKQWKKKKKKKNSFWHKHHSNKSESVWRKQNPNLNSLDKKQNKKEERKNNGKPV